MDIDLSGDAELEERLPIRPVVKLLRPPPAGRILHYRPASMRYALAIADRYREASVVAYPMAGDALEAARTAARWATLDNVSAAEPDSNAVHPFWFDRILVIDLLDAISDAELQSLRSWLHIEGAMLLIDWDSSIERPVGPSHKRGYTAREACARLERAGFEPAIEPVPEFRYHYAIRAARGGE